ncbi:MAG: carboxypeptidase regulatory-like domain-containing protein [bacterium]
MKQKAIIVGLTFLALLLLSMSCSEERTTMPTGAEVSMELVFPKSAATQLVDRVTMEVQALPDFIHFDTALVVDKKFQFAEFQIPEGPASFSLTAFTGELETFAAMLDVEIIGGQRNSIVVVFSTPAELGTVNGVVTDAVTGLPISGALVALGDKSSVTDSEGAYSITEVPPGNYTMYVSLEGYISVERSVDIVGGEQIVNLVMSTFVEGWRFVLTWNGEPQDLDLHLWTGEAHIYYYEPGEPGDPPYAYLDIDDIDGYGPETITVEQVQSLCKIAVNNYSGWPLLRDSGARIEIYSGSSRLWTYNVPSSGNGPWWYVCDLKTDGTLDTKDYITDTAPGVVGRGGQHQSK